MKALGLGSRVYVKEQSLLLAPVGSRGTVIEILFGGFVVKLDNAAEHGIPPMVFSPEELGHLRYIGLREGRKVMVKGYSSTGNDFDGKEGFVLKSYEDGHLRVEVEGSQAIVKRSQLTLRNS